MAWTQQQLDELEEAIALGSLRVSYSSGGSTKEVVYRSLDEMFKIRDKIRQALGLVPAGATRFRPTTSKLGCK